MRHLTVLTVMATSVALSACGTIGTVNPGLDSVHQPVVSRADYVFDIAAPGGERLSSSEAARLKGWFDSIDLRYGDRVSVDSQGTGASGREAVAAVAGSYGLLVEDSAPATQGEIAPGSIRVVVSRMTAAVPNCPDWSRPANPNFGGSAMSNYGCAINANLAAMVADPRDLIAGRTPPAAVDAKVSNKAINTYRTAPSTGAGALKIESSKGGN